jgi:hypothetical protein
VILDLIHVNGEIREIPSEFRDREGDLLVFGDRVQPTLEPSLR